LIDSLSAFKKDYAVIYQNQQQGLINRNGEIKLEPTFNAIKLNDDGSVFTRLSNQWTILDGQDKVLRRINADSINVIGKNLLKIHSGGKVQLADQSFKPISHEWFSKIGNFSRRKADFLKDNRFGVISSTGSIVVKPIYASLRVDDDRLIAQLPTDKRFILLDSTGNAISNRTYDAIRSFNGKFYPVRNRGFWGAMNSTGKEIVACTHDSIGQVLDDLLVVK
jgi:hypothetical protein